MTARRKGSIEHLDLRGVLAQVEYSCGTFPHTWIHTRQVQK